MCGGRGRRERGKQDQIQADGLFLNSWFPCFTDCSSFVGAQACAQLNAVIPVQFEIKVLALSLSLLDFLCRNPADSFCILGFLPVLIDSSHRDFLYVLVVKHQEHCGFE